ncbi:MAG: PEP-CTERM sorting domain-containing protein [Chthonomonas sp.]|nr:PEP-CTERM sorting domain-containing protein [Chthonomonas sp.]
MVVSGSLGFAADRYFVGTATASWRTPGIWDGGIIPTSADSVFIGYDPYLLPNPGSITLTDSGSILLANLSTRAVVQLANLTVSSHTNVDATGHLRMLSTSGRYTFNDLTMTSGGRSTIGGLLVATKLDALQNNQLTGAGRYEVGALTLGAGSRLTNARLTATSINLTNSTSYVSTSNVTVKHLDLGAGGSVNATTRIDFSPGATITGTGTLQSTFFGFAGSGIRTLHSSISRNNFYGSIENDTEISGQLTGTSTLVGGTAKLQDGFNGALIAFSTVELFGTSTGDVTGSGPTLTIRGTLNGSSGALSTINYGTFNGVGINVTNYGVNNAQTFSDNLKNYGTAVFTSNASHSAASFINYGEIRFEGSGTHEGTTTAAHPGMLTLNGQSHLRLKFVASSPTRDKFQYIHVSPQASMDLAIGTNTNGVYGQMDLENAPLDFATFLNGRMTKYRGGMVGGTISNFSNTKFVGSSLWEDIRFQGSNVFQGEEYNPDFDHVVFDNPILQNGDYVRVNVPHKLTAKNATVNGALHLEGAFTDFLNSSISATGKVIVNNPYRVTNIVNSGRLEIRGQIKPAFGSEVGHIANIVNNGTLDIFRSAFSVSQLTNNGTMMVNRSQVSGNSSFPVINNGQLTLVGGSLSNINNNGYVEATDGSEIGILSMSPTARTVAKNESIVSVFGSDFVNLERRIETDATSRVHISGDVAGLTIDNDDLQSRNRYWQEVLMANSTLTGGPIRNVLNGYFTDTTFQSPLILDNSSAKSLEFTRSRIPEGSKFSHGFISIGSSDSMPNLLETSGYSSIRKSTSASAESGTIRMQNARFQSYLEIGRDMELLGTVTGTPTAEGFGSRLGFSRAVNRGSMLVDEVSFRDSTNYSTLSARNSIEFFGSTNHGSVISRRLTVGSSENFGQMIAEDGPGTEGIISYAGINRGQISARSGSWSGSNRGTATFSGGAGTELYLSNESTGSLAVTGVVKGEVNNRGNVSFLNIGGSQSFRYVGHSGVQEFIGETGPKVEVFRIGGHTIIAPNASGVLPVFRGGFYADTTYDFSGSMEIRGTYSPGFFHDIHVSGNHAIINWNVNILTPNWTVERGPFNIRLVYAVPEPSSVLSLLAGAALLLRRKRKAP